MENTMNYEDFFKKSQEAYSWLEDDLSKQVFEQRIIFGMTNSLRGLEGLGKLMKPDLKKENVNFDIIEHKFNKDDVIVIYGAGNIGATVCRFIKNKSYKELIFCDRYYKELEGKVELPIISPEELFKSHQNSKIIVATNYYANEVFNLLKENGIQNQNILFGNYWDVEGQYFDEIIKFNNDEVFVDCGVLDGGTSMLFSKNVNHKFKHIHMFEPEPDFANNSINNLTKNEIQNFTMHNIGVWDKQEVLKFFVNLSGDGFSACVENNSINLIELPVDSLDNVFHNTNKEDLPTFIKMDVESAELNALKGAKNIIQKNKPKLAISIYHKPHDILELLIYIKELVPEYKLYLRHYTIASFETILYAII